MPEASFIPLSDLTAAEDWLDGLINRERRSDWSQKRLDLRAIEALLDALEHPERGLSVIHIAGSKGKGSTALMVEAILCAAGRAVGTFTSPHLERWTERFRIGGREVDAERLVAAVNRVGPCVERQRADPVLAPSFFDATTAAAWCLFREAVVDHAVVEVGLGGRLDSTNAVAPAVTCITSIELEHTDKLGDTLGAIAGEKAGILKPGVPAVVGALPDEALEVVEAKASAVGAPLLRLGEEITWESRGSGADRVLRVREGTLEVEARLPVLGVHQAPNAALAVVCAARVLEPEGLPGACALGLGALRLPGRIEVLCTAPRVLVDSAHTEASVRSLAAVLREESDPVDLVLSISGDKQVDILLDILLPEVAAVTLTRANSDRSLDPEALAEKVRARVDSACVHVEPDAEIAIRSAASGAGAHTLCVAGSVYLAGIARRVLAPR